MFDFVAGGKVIGLGKLYIIPRFKFLIVASNEYFEDTTTVSGLHVSCGERKPQLSRRRVVRLPSQRVFCRQGHCDIK
jgi:hypothetical protein